MLAYERAAAADSVSQSMLDAPQIQEAFKAVVSPEQGAMRAFLYQELTEMLEVQKVWGKEATRRSSHGSATKRSSHGSACSEADAAMDPDDMRRHSTASSLSVDSLGQPHRHERAFARPESPLTMPLQALLEKANAARQEAMTGNAPPVTEQDDESKSMQDQASLVFHGMKFMLADTDSWHRLVVLISITCCRDVWIFMQSHGLDMGECFTGLLKDPFPCIRRFAIEGMRRMGHNAANDAALLTKIALEDTDRRLRIEAVRTMTAVGDKAIKELIRIMRESDLWTVRAEAARSLALRAAQIRSAKQLQHAALHGLEEASRDRYAGVREAAIASIGQLGVTALPWVGRLTRALRDPDVRVRTAACRSLGNIMYSYSQQGMSSASPEFKMIMRMTLQALTNVLGDREPCITIHQDAMTMQPHGEMSALPSTIWESGMAVMSPTGAQLSGKKVLSAKQARSFSCAASARARLTLRSAQVQALYQTAEAAFRRIGQAAVSPLVQRLLVEGGSRKSGGFVSRMSTLRALSSTGCLNDEISCCMLSEWIASPTLHTAAYKANLKYAAANVVPVREVYLHSMHTVRDGFYWAVLYGVLGELYVVFSLDPEEASDHVRPENMVDVELEGKLGDETVTVSMHKGIAEELEEIWEQLGDQLSGAIERVSELRMEEAEAKYRLHAENLANGADDAFYQDPSIMEALDDRVMHNAQKSMSFHQQLSRSHSQMHASMLESLMGSMGSNEPAPDSSDRMHHFLGLTAVQHAMGRVISSASPFTRQTSGTSSHSVVDSEPEVEHFKTEINRGTEPSSPSQRDILSKRFAQKSKSRLGTSDTKDFGDADAKRDHVQRIYVTGYGFGGSLASAAACRIAMMGSASKNWEDVAAFLSSTETEGGENPVVVMTFGAPSIISQVEGGKSVAKALSSRSRNVAFQKDPVAHLMGSLHTRVQHFYSNRRGLFGWLFGSAGKDPVTRWLHRSHVARRRSHRQKHSFKPILEDVLDPETEHLSGLGDTFVATLANPMHYTNALCVRQGKDIAANVEGADSVRSKPTPRHGLVALGTRLLGRTRER